MENSEKSQILVTCQPYLSDALEKEVLALGFQLNAKFLTGIGLTGTMNDCIRLNLNLRTASKVMWLIKDIEAHNANQLYEAAKNLPWEDLLLPTEKFSIHSTVSNPTIDNNMFANLKLKDAIVDRYRSQTSMRPDTSSSSDEAVIYLYWKGSKAQIYYDTSGESLAKHGYRRIPGKAPMLESLAAATILSTRWDQEKSSFVNPMCGSGTLAIEAALIACRIPPSEFRSNYAFMHIPGYDKSYYDEQKAIIQSQIVKHPDVEIVASDISSVAIKNSQINAYNAGVKDIIKFEVCPFQKTTLPQENKGIVYLNPEYGERLGEEEILATVYEQIGDFFKQQCEGYWAYIFTGNLALAKKVGLRPTSKKTFYNAKIECRLLEYEIYEGSRKAKKQN